MVRFYNSGDPDIAAAISGGAIPIGATKATHPTERDLFKTGLLACQYGIGVAALAGRIKRSVPFADNFRNMHFELFPDYWRWSDEVVAEAIRSGCFCSRHGWRYTVSPPFNVRSLRNWPIQTLGAEIGRASCRGRW